MTNRRLKVLLSALLVFNFVGAQSALAEEDPFPGVSTGSEIPGTKIWSQPGVTQSQWESTDTYKAFSCPAGAGNGMGVDMNFTTSKSDDRWFAYCVKTWRSSVDVNAEANFRAAQNAAIAAATAESQAWNAANPGKQKCIQWGPIIHANGVSTASGGVCANVVAPGPTTTVQSQDAPTVEGPTTVPTTTTPTAQPTPVAATPDANPELANEGNGKPFTRVLPGQLSTSQCPVGYQAANGIIVAIGKGTYTECWPTNAWQAWQLGGSTWEQFKSSGGSFNVQAVIDLNNAIAALKSEAKSVAQTAADSTPGIQRCSKWSGYGQSGQECAYTFVAPTPGTVIPGATNSDTRTATTPQISETSTVLTRPSETSTISVQSSDTQTVLNTRPETSTVLSTSTPETSTATTTIDPTSVKVSQTTSGTSQLGLATISVEGTTKEIAKLIPKIVTKVTEQKSLATILTKLDAMRAVTYSKVQVLPNERSIEETAVSLTPDICSVKGAKVTSLKPGTCIFSYELIGASGNSFTVEKQIVFKK
jgi:hypothetical protein